MALTIPRAVRQLMESPMGIEATQIVEDERSASAGRSRAPHDRGLLLIGLFKLLKAVFFFFVGLGAIHLVEKNLGDEVMRLAMALRRDPEGRVVQFALEKADLIDAHRLREIGGFSFAYAALALTEGVGLVLEQVWAEYLTLTLTISFLPWELFELARHASWIRCAVLLTNLAVLGYILWLLRNKRRQARMEQT